MAEHIARDALNLVVMQDELPQTSRQERGNVNQLIVGKVQILQFSVDKDIFEDSFEILYYILKKIYILYYVTIYYIMTNTFPKFYVLFVHSDSNSY